MSKILITTLVVVVFASMSNVAAAPEHRYYDTLVLSSQYEELTRTPEKHEVENYVREVAKSLGIDEASFVYIAKCESGFNIYAKNPVSPASGVMQFMPNTFSTWAPRYGYVGHSIWNWRSQIDVAGRMIRDGQRHQWEC